jgi:MoxR-like ATPase
MRASQAKAFLAQRDFVIPDDVKLVAEGVLCHRLILKPDEIVSGISPAQILSQVMSSVPVPITRRVSLQ